jgi:hypothetical protein
MLVLELLLMLASMQGQSSLLIPQPFPKVCQS